jgi:hypothetical protein
MATTTALGSGATDNNNGAVLGPATSAILSGTDLGAHAPDNKYVYDGGDIAEAYSAGEFLYDDSNPVAPLMSYTRGGVDAGTLSPALVPELTQGVHRIEAVKTNKVATAIRAGYWDIYSGAWTTPPTDADDTFHKAITGSTYVDYATRGEKVTYTTGGEPTNDSY